MLLFEPRENVPFFAMKAATLARSFVCVLYPQVFQSDRENQDQAWQKIVVASSSMAYLIVILIVIDKNVALLIQLMKAGVSTVMVVLALDDRKLLDLIL